MKKGMVMQIRRFWSEFKAFSIKGNMLDLAIAVVLGTAFTAVITSLVKNVFMPLLGYITRNNDGYKTWKLGEVEIGIFLGELINFFLISLVLFIVIVKILGRLRKRSTPPPPPAPATRECPLCCSSIPARAVKCPHCTGDIAAKP